jgi:6-phosphogluconolactonase (cycloisomerase 2 family)
MSRRLILVFIAALSLGLVGCDGSSLSSASSQTYLVAGSLTGLSSSGASVTLANNGGDPLVLDANGGFHFATPLPDGATYSITVASEPAGETCTVINGTGTVNAGNVTSIAVSCSAVPAQYTVGGAVAGLSTGQSVTLKDNGSDTVTVSANGPFVFPTSLVNSAAYDVTVGTQPTGETCAASHATGTINNTNVASVSVVCTVNAPTTYTVGGQVSGLSTGTSVTLLDNGADAMAVSANGAFTFSSALSAGSAYAVTVGTQPAGETCAVSNGSATSIAANVTGVTVACTPNPTYSIGGTVSGLKSGDSVTLQDNGSDSLTVGANGAFVFATQLPGAAPYDVTVLTQPAGETCTVTGGNSTVGTANVASVNVSCIPTQFVYADSGGDIYGFSVDPTTGSLTALSNSPFAAGNVPVAMTFNPAGTFLYVVLAGSNELAVFGVDPNTGTLTAVPGAAAPTGDDPVAVAMTPSGKFVYVTNINSDTVSAFSIDPTTGTLTSIGSYTAGTAPYSIAIDPTGQFVYVGNYNSNTVSAYTINATTGALTAISGSPYPAGSGPFGIAVNAGGTLVYTANAGGGISGYTINPSTGALTSVGMFASSVEFESVTFNANGTILYAAGGTGQIYAYTVDSGTGALTQAGSPVPQSNGPYGLALSESGSWLYVAGTGGGVSGYTVNPSTGVLTQITGSPFAAGTNTQDVVITP